MPALQNMRQEAFCIALVNGTAAEGNRPMSQAAAYREAGYQGKDGNVAWSTASHLASNPKVKNRMSELIAEKSRAASLSRVEILEQLQRQTLAAEADSSHSAAIHGTELLGKEVCGMFKDRAEVDINSPMGRSRAELQGELDSLLLTLGYAKPNVGPLLELTAVPAPGARQARSTEPGSD